MKSVNKFYDKGFFISKIKGFEKSGNCNLGILFLKKGWNKIEYWGNGISKLYLKSKTNKNIYETSINSTQFIYLNKNKLAFAFLKNESDIEINKLKICNVEKNDLISSFSQNNNLIVSINAMDESFWKFIDDSEKNLLKFDIFNVKQNYYSKITFENSHVLFEGDYSDIRELLMIKKYDNILFWDYNYDCLKAIYKSDYHTTSIYFNHFIDKNYYFNFEVFQRIYGCVAPKMTAAQYAEFNNLKNIFLNFNYSKNCIFLFECTKEKEFFEEKLSMKFNYYQLFNPDSFEEVKEKNKNNGNIKKVAFIKDFDQYSRNAVDVDEQIVELLKNKEYFTNLEIDFLGNGAWKDILLEKFLTYDNVKYYNLSDVNLTNYDLLIFSNRDYINKKLVNFAKFNNIPCIVNSSNLFNINIPNELVVNNNEVFQFVNLLEKILFDEKFYNLVISKIHEYNKKENDNNYLLINEIKNVKNYKLDPVNNLSPVLSIIIPAYGVEKYVTTTIWSLLNQKNYRKIEILVINDGSKDNTLNVAKKIKKDLFDNDTSILKIIDKENGGHGSVINRGLEEITGKYVKIVDGDDTLNSYNLSLLINILENEDVDVVLNDYKEDYIAKNEEVPINFYENVPTNKLLDFETLCKNKVLAYWGPLLPTATYNVNALKKRKFKITEKIFYDDMEWNYNSIMNIDSLKYFDLYIYNHFIGREGQSVTMDGLIRNYQMHRIMTINLINLYNNSKNIGKYKKRFLYKNYVLKMIKTHYMIVIDYFDKPNPFREFEKELIKYPEFYNHKEVVNRKIKIYRKTNGNIKYFEFLKPFYNILRKLIRR